MDRRKFIKGVVSAAIAAALPGTEMYTHKTYGTAHYVIPKASLENSLISAADLSERSLEQLVVEVANKRADALAFSMRQTREHMTANVLNRVFGDGVELNSIPHPAAFKTWWDLESECLHVESIPHEEMYV